MTNPDIRAALEAAALAICDMQNRRRFISRCECKEKGKTPWGGKAPCAGLIEDATAAIAAFLSAPPPSADTIRLHLGEVSPQGMRDIHAYHRWLAAAIERETTP